MEAIWFEAKIKYVKLGEDGKEYKKNESYLLDAISYTEAESRIMTEMQEIIPGSYIIASLKKSNISEIVTSNDENDDRWYKAKVALIDADDVSGKEKKSNIYYLIAASSINRALENLDKSLASYVIPCEVVSLSDTQIMDIFPYEATIVSEKLDSNLDNFESDNNIEEEIDENENLKSELKKDLNDGNFSNAIS